MKKLFSLSVSAVIVFEILNIYFIMPFPGSQRINSVVEDDQLISEQSVYNLAGKPLNQTGAALKRINTYREFWHSWQTFHPNTEKYSHR